MHLGLKKEQKINEEEEEENWIIESCFALWKQLHKRRIKISVLGWRGFEIMLLKNYLFSKRLEVWKMMATSPQDESFCSDESSPY